MLISSGSDPKLSKADKRPYLITCPIEFNGKLPTSVSLTSQPCEVAENNLMIIDNQPINGIKKRFGVCTKQIFLDNRNFTPKLVEWIELLRILGAAKIHIIVKYVHPEMKAFLDFYEEKGIVEVFPFLEPSGVSTSKMRSNQSRLLQKNMMNDCFYRVRNLYELLVFLDPDEVIIPVMESDKTWDDMLRHVDLDSRKCSYASQNIYYPDKGANFYHDIPKYNYMLQHVERSVNGSKFGDAIKSFFVPDKIVVVHNHHALFSWYSGLKRSRLGYFPANVSQLSHYRDVVGKAFKETRLDTTIWKFKDKLVSAMNQTLNEVKFDLENWFS